MLKNVADCGQIAITSGIIDTTTGTIEPIKTSDGTEEIYIIRDLKTHTFVQDWLAMRSQKDKRYCLSTWRIT
jgi:hypothetical protein